jgi:hypothetical protein
MGVYYIAAEVVFGLVNEQIEVTGITNTPISPA